MNVMHRGMITAALCGAAIASLAAQSGPNTSVSRPAITSGAAIAHYTATAPFAGDSGAPAKVDIMIERWSTDQEASELEKAMSTGGTDALLQRLQSVRRRAGVLLIPGVQGAGARARIRRPVNLYFARRQAKAGVTQVVLVADHYMAFGKPTGDWPSTFEVSLLDIRIAADGTGVGKVANATALAANQKTGALELPSFEAQPASLMQVQSAQQ